MISTIQDPEKVYSLEQLDVVQEDLVTVQYYQEPETKIIDQEINDQS